MARNVRFLGAYGVLFILWVTLLSGCASDKKKEAYYDKLSALEMYELGKKHLKKKRYSLAIEDFEALDARYPFGDYTDQALLAMIYCHYMSDDLPSAEAQAERFLRIHPRHPHVDYAYYLRGLTHYYEALSFFDRYLPMEREDRDTTPFRQAYADFSTLVLRYPDSPYREVAMQRMVYIRNLLAKQELQIARFYMKRKAYLAAAHRANVIVENYDQTPSVHEALTIMVEAYDRLNLPTLAHETKLVLEKNFLESPTGVLKKAT